MTMQPSAIIRNHDHFLQIMYLHWFYICRNFTEFWRHKLITMDRDNSKESDSVGPGEEITINNADSFNNDQTNLIDSPKDPLTNSNTIPDSTTDIIPNGNSVPNSTEDVLPNGTTIPNSTADPAHCGEDGDVKVRRTSSTNSERESLVRNSSGSPQRTGSKYVKRQESVQSSRSIIRNRRSLRSQSFNQSPENDNLRRSFRRMRSGSLNYPHHNSIVSSFLEELAQIEPLPDSSQGMAREHGNVTKDSISLYLMFKTDVFL